MMINKFNRFGIFLAIAFIFFGCGVIQKMPLSSAVSRVVQKTETVELKLPVNFQGEVSVDPYGMQTKTDKEGWIRLELPFIDRKVVIKKGEDSLELEAWNWMPPYRYIALADGSIKRNWPWVEFRRFPADTTSNPTFNVLCKSEYPGRALINGKEVKMYKTGIFFKEVTFVGCRTNLHPVVPASSLEEDDVGEIAPPSSSRDDGLTGNM